VARVVPAVSLYIVVVSLASHQPNIPEMPSNGPDAGVTSALAVEYAPCPMPFTAATRNVYAVPLVRPVTVALVAADVPSLKFAQDEPPLLEYCTV
jgi:hypothetical protein